ncbi:Microtubule-associated protein RP/EB family member 1 [Psilocybe cubensis]|uniref:Microtubule binding protein n=2 Tax=Psilocybe cubensis TaxID=181762 RepID=A0A8H7XM04_PSICU|nr:Microtubule-associated protein RP/EB family member 1 [Psilocybe cubensis]KAH9480097.1 Microtubule-associated protein RP/EB family member 1 [Psilocybe cubensis]
MTAVSRTDLLNWLNELLQISYSKIEQCGTGGAYCQILDSIYGDIPMNRVKMNAKHEYEYVANYKIMQTAFKAKKIDKPIPVEKLVKCKMQDNLEFLQWMKRFWDANYGGQGYDAVARRKGAPMEGPATVAPLNTSRATPAVGLGVGARTGGRTPIGGHRSGSALSNEAVQHLQEQVKELSSHLEGLEKERDFYFEKLRDIEILVQAQMETLESEGKEDSTLKEIQKILYSTEEGFEVPDAGAPVDEEETF